MKKLKALRKERRMTFAELALRAGTSRAMIWRYESGRVSPTIQALTKLAKALDVEVCELIEEGGDV